MRHYQAGDREVGFRRVLVPARGVVVVSRTDAPRRQIEAAFSCYLVQLPEVFGIDCRHELVKSADVNALPWCWLGAGAVGGDPSM